MAQKAQIENEQTIEIAGVKIRNKTGNGIIVSFAGGEAAIEVVACCIGEQPSSNH